jgi:two-component system, NarL family, sensor kinase
VPASRARDLRVLKTIAEALNGAGHVNDALQTTLEQVTTLLGLRTGWVWLVDPQSGRFYGAVAHRLPPYLTEPVHMTGHACWCLKAFRAAQLTPDNIDVMECSRLRAAVTAGERARTRGLRFHASIPLYFGDRPLGVMNLAAPAWRKLTRRELDLLSTIASQVGVAIERARLAGERVHVARLDERTKLARDLHDTLAQGLTAIGLHLEAALAGLPPRAAAAHPVQRALEVTRSTLDHARGSIRQLRSSGGVPLPEALRALAHRVAADTGIRVHVQSSGDSMLRSADADEIVRIASEALVNVRKHAGATDVQVTLEATAHRLRLTIADNGRGFDSRKRSRGFGIVGMRERAQTIGGRLSVSSQSGRGTRVTLTMKV